MGKDLVAKYGVAESFFSEIDEVVGYPLSKMMLEGTDEDLRQTYVTQPAIFCYSMAILQASFRATPDAVAGHSLGEFGALVAAGVIPFKAGLKLVFQRATAMQRACEINPSTMAAVLGLADEAVKEAIKDITGEVVVAANFNSPGQVVISGSFNGIEVASERLKQAGAKRVVQLQVGGAFHSPLMLPAQEDLAKAIEETRFFPALCPVYQNVDAQPSQDPEELKRKLLIQLTSPVLWTQTIERMVTAGITEFIEVGPGNVLQGLVRKINKEAQVSAL
jgi:[acyl-carrier-protein] S-malonyltransferase